MREHSETTLDAGELIAGYRRQRSERFGWPDTVTCAQCGDTGSVPDWGGMRCTCAVGGRLALAELRRDAWAAAVPAAMRDWTLETARDREAATALRGWQAAINDGTPAARSVILYGPPGSGKTGLAIGALAAVCRAGFSVGFAVVTDWLDDQRPGASDDGDAVRVLRQAQAPEVLVLDDLGAEKSSDWTLERLYALLNARMNAGRPTIITTNLPRSGLQERYGGRILRRLTRDDSALELVVTRG